MILALAGNPNCGKTTLFNALTGANARTGNFPGVTVTRSEAVCRARPDVTLVDLPGVYALRPFSDEERVTRAYLLSSEADAIRRRCGGHGGAGAGAGHPGRASKRGAG